MPARRSALVALLLVLVTVPAAAAPPAGAAAVAVAVPAASAAEALTGSGARPGESIALTPVPRAPASRSYGWPLDPPHTVTRRFDPPPQPWLAGHRGVDLAGGLGATVRSAGAGTVAFAGTIAGRGVVSVDHPDGLRTTYEPVEPSVARGQAVRLGEPIGILVGGHPGCPVAACLHWGLRRGEMYLDPLGLVGVGRVRLLPLEAA